MQVLLFQPHLAYVGKPRDAAWLTGIAGVPGKPAGWALTEISAWKRNTYNFRASFIPMQDMSQSTNHLHTPLPSGMPCTRTRRMWNTFRDAKPLLLPYGLLRISVSKAWVAVRPIILSSMQKAQESHQCDSVQSVPKKTHGEEMTEKSPRWKKAKAPSGKCWKVLKMVVLFQSPNMLSWWKMLCKSMKENSRDRAKRLKTIISFMCQNSGWKSKWFISRKKCGS